MSPLVVRVLFVDDQPDYLEAMLYWMKQRGYEVLTTTDGKKGIDLVRQNKADIIFVDYKMPGIDGIEVISKIREFNKTIPIVVLTAYMNDLMLNEVSHLNIAGFYPKRGEFEDLESVLKCVLEVIKKPKMPS